MQNFGMNKISNSLADFNKMQICDRRGCQKYSIGMFVLRQNILVNL